MANLVHRMLHETVQSLKQAGYRTAQERDALALVTYDDAAADEAALTTWLRARLLFPIAYNNGEPIPGSEMVSFLRELLSRCASGFTLSESGGIALDGRTVECDHHVAVDAWVYDGAALRAILGRWAGRLGQRAVYLETFPGARLEFIAAPHAQNAPPERAAEPMSAAAA